MEITRARFETLRLSEEGRVLVVTLDHPRSDKNLFDWALMEDLADLMGLLRREREAGAVLLTAAGRFFSAGGSFDLFAEMDRTESVVRMGQLTRRLYGDMLSVTLPIVCAMNGPAHGAGCSLVLLSDFVVAPDDVTLSDPHVSRGLAAGDGPFIWSLFMGPVRAKRFLLTGDVLSAAEALELGMFSEVCPPEEAFPRAMALAQRLAASPPNAVAHTKLLCNKYVRQAFELSFDAGFALEMLDFRSRDHREAIAAFKERRAPRYEGA